MLTPIYLHTQETPQGFVEFWSAQMTAKEMKQEKIYAQLICKGALSQETVIGLFTWKNGGTKLSEAKREAANRLYRDVHLIKTTQAAEEFLRHQTQAAIWTIFAIHCVFPKQFPIYDQHTHRAMAFIKNGSVQEIEKDDRKKIKTYLEEYRPFVDLFGSYSRAVDHALFVFGRFLKSYPNFPKL